MANMLAHSDDLRTKGGHPWAALFVALRDRANVMPAKGSGFSGMMIEVIGRQADKMETSNF